MDKKLLTRILDDISRVRIIIAGDFCLDAYWFIDESMSEVSVETGEKTNPVRTQRYSLGGAGNVAANLAALGVKQILAFGVTGPDPFGAEMRRIMEHQGINTENLLLQKENWSTHTYSKPYTGEKELGRIDFGNYNVLSPETADLLIGNLDREIPHADIVIVNQQVPSGIHTEYFRKSLLKVIGRYPEKIFITDSRNYNSYFTGTWRKMNDTEASRLCGIERDTGETVPLDELKSYALSLQKLFGKPLFITRGSRGSVTVDENGIAEIPGMMITAKVDTVGAGDSYLAGAAAALAAGYDIGNAALLGTFTAGVTVQKLFQTGTATPEEILAIGSDPDFVYYPDLAEDERKARFFENTEIEIITVRNDKEKIEYAIFDNDGTISTLREGWEKIMGPMMVKVILGDEYDDAGEYVLRKVTERVEEYIDKTTGVQTLVQMNGLAGLVKEFGFVKEKDILDEHGYKELYNTELMNMVGTRMKKIEKGELAVEDFAIKGSLAFLKILHGKGIKLFLASGTDTADVIRESELLGYAGLFEGRIFGAVGDMRVEAKKVVLDRILDSLGESAGGKVITFGDGPVEIRETRKKNGLTVGVASNEIMRSGLNLRKRKRLINAGADYLIPDFSVYGDLLKLLNI